VNMKTISIDWIFRLESNITLLDIPQKKHRFRSAILSFDDSFFAEQY